MVKNLLLALLNWAVGGVFLVLHYDLPILLYYLGFSLLCWLLLGWNALGELLTIRVIFRAKPMPQNALIAPAVLHYLGTAPVKECLSEKGCTVYYAQSKIPCFVPISRRRAVVSLALEDALIENGAGVLSKGVPLASYDPKVLLARRILLLVLLMDVLLLLLARGVSIVGALIIQFCCCCATLITSGALFEGPRAIWDALAAGWFLGRLLNKICDLFNNIQDKLAEIMLRMTNAYSFQSLQMDGAISTR